MAQYKYTNLTSGEEFDVHRVILHHKFNQKSCGRIVYAIKPCRYSGLLCKLIRQALSKTFTISRERVAHYVKDVNDNHIRKECFIKKDNGDVDIMLLPMPLTFNSNITCVNIMLLSYEIERKLILSIPDFHSGSYYDYCEKNLDKELANIANQYIAPISDFFANKV